ncbi:MAG: ComF family protein [Spirochaetes bacterium]|nr:ComF family protein [Spirochaetota bacterium]
MLKTIERLLFPEFCYICGRDKTDDFVVCGECGQNLHYFDNSIGMSAHRDESMPVFIDRMNAVFIYDKHIRKLFYQYKSMGKKHVADYFLDQILKQIDFSLYDIDFISFVPLHWTKKIKRGFNQSQLIAKKLGLILNVENVNFLIKNRTTKAQKDVNFADRHINAIGSYSIFRSKAHLLKDVSILLVDDVFTTGATLNECARIFKKNGVKNVFSLTVGITNDKK